MVSMLIQDDRCILDIIWFRDSKSCKDIYRKSDDKFLLDRKCIQDRTCLEDSTDLKDEMWMLDKKCVLDGI